MQHGYVFGGGGGGVRAFVCGHIADLISFVLNYPVKMK